MKKQRSSIGDYGLETFVDMNEEERKKAIAKAEENDQKRKKVEEEKAAAREAQAKALAEQKRKEAALKLKSTGSMQEEQKSEVDTIPRDDRELAMNLYMTEMLIIFRGI